MLLNPKEKSILLALIKSNYYGFIKINLTNDNPIIRQDNTWNNDKGPTSCYVPDFDLRVKCRKEKTLFDNEKANACASPTKPLPIIPTFIKTYLI